MPSARLFVAASHPIRITFAPCMPRALGGKAREEFAARLCQIHHRLVHRVGTKLSRTSMRRTAGLPSKTPSTPTRWPPACANLWPSAAPGRAAPSTCCGSALIASVTMLLRAAPTGPTIPGRSRAASGARRRFCGPWASTFPLVVKAVPEAGSSGSYDVRKHRQNGQQRPRQRATIRTSTTHAETDRCRLRQQVHLVRARARPGTGPSRSQTTLTVLTQTPALVLGKVRSEFARPVPPKPPTGVIPAQTSFMKGQLGSTRPSTQCTFWKY
jgi:hypothetical protein